MDEITTKAIIIGVSIFVTLMIVTVLIFEFTQIRDVYKVAAETNVTFEERLNEFDKYKDSNNYFNGLDVKNTIEKYRYDELVDVCIKNGEVITCGDSVNISESKYKEEYKASMIENTSKYKIIFEEE